jgi:hypothetical protein
MKNTQFSLSILLLLFSFGIIQSKAQVKTLKRSEGYIGLHLDFHAFANDTIGGTFTESLIDSMLSITKPDYIQVDCKGHPGISSYPTKVGYPAPVIIKNPLPIWREATAKRNVSLYVHHSGVADDKQINLHPDWAVIKSDGTLDKRSTSLHSPYVSEIFIPQLQVLCYLTNQDMLDLIFWI